MAATYSINDNTAQSAVSYTSITDILNLLPDNTQKLISPRDARDAVFSAWENSVFRYTTIGAYEYIGINRENIKNKIFFGKKQLSNLDIMTSGLLSSNTDIFFYNTKTDTNPSQDLKLSFLAGSNTSLHPYSPYLEVKGITGASPSNDMNFVNPSPNGGDINLLSDYGRLSFNDRLTIPSIVELDGLIANPTESNSNDLFLVRNPSGFVELKKVKVDYANVGNPLSTTNIYGSPVLINGFPIEFTELTPTVATVGGVGIGMTFSEVPIVEMIRMILYPELGPIVDVDLQYNVLERNHVSNTPISYDYSLTKRSYDLTSTLINILSDSVNINLVGQVVTGSGLITQTFPNVYTFSNTQIISSVEGVFTFSVNTVDGTFSATASDTLNFVYPYFYGFSSTLANNTPLFNNIILTDLDKQVDIKQDQNLSIYGTNKYLYFSYPASYGTVSTIYDSNDYLIYDAGDPSPSWTYSQINGVNSPSGYWNGITYMVYRTINLSSVPYPQYYKFNF
jgi:hypothetical protein